MSLVRIGFVVDFINGIQMFHAKHNYLTLNILVSVLSTDYCTGI